MDIKTIDRQALVGIVSKFRMGGVWNVLHNSDDVPETFAKRVEPECTCITCTELELLRYLPPLIKGLSMRYHLAVMGFIPREFTFDAIQAVQEISNLASVSSMYGMSGEGEQSAFLIGYLRPEFGKLYDIDLFF